ncbi:hypothetical protein HPMBJEAJ_00074 [Aeromonas phage avDM6]|nr:hypothetical protein HPMBJEAJ_00074 [Aeromonas phage avDM6]
MILDDILFFTYCFVFISVCAFALIQLRYQTIIRNNYDLIERKLKERGVVIISVSMGDAYRFRLDVDTYKPTCLFLPWKTYRLLKRMEKFGASDVVCSLLPKDKPVKVVKPIEFNPK